MKRNRFYQVFIITLILVVLAGCNKAALEASEGTEENIIENSSEDKVVTDKASPEVKVIFDYANAINEKKYTEALDKLGTVLKPSYAGSGDIYMRNIESMEIKELVDKTDIRENGKWDINPRNLGENIYCCKVYYAVVNYKINNIVESYLKDGLNYFKIVTLKETANSEWKIGEMSGIGK